jgi:hypothetical protein
MRVPQHLLLLAVATLVSQCVGFHIQRVVVGLYSSSVGDSWYGFKSNSNNNNHHHHHHVFPTLPRTTAGRRTPRRLITAVAVQTNSNNGGASETSVQDDYADIKAELTNYLAFREQVGADEAMKKEAGKIVGGTKGNVVLDYVSGSPNKEITLEMPNIFDYSELDKYGFGVRLPSPANGLLLLGILSLKELTLIVVSVLFATVLGQTNNGIGWQIGNVQTHGPSTSRQPC